MSTMNPKVDGFLRKATKWKNEFAKLRTIILDCGLTEGVKWRHPCYTLHDGNVVLIHGFKDYCALLFFKGALLKDAKGILVQQTKNVQAARQIRFTSLEQIIKMESIVKAYVDEAIAVEKAGLKVQMKKEPEPVPEEFQKQLKERSDLKAAFEGLTPGRRRAYILHFSSAKQSKTRAARVEKWTQHILDGKGLDDE